MNNKGHLYFIMWTSGSGKWTLIDNLKQSEFSEGIYMPLSYKSREKRESEIDGVDSHFISQESFEEMISNNEFLEYEKVYGHSFYYGTKYSEVINNWIDKWKRVLKEVDMEWLKGILQNFPELKSSVTTIFLSLSPEKFAERIESRWEHMDSESFQKRLLTLEKENEEAKEYCDYIIDTSEKTPEEVLVEVKKILA